MGREIIAKQFVQPVFLSLKSLSATAIEIEK